VAWDGHGMHALRDGRCMLKGHIPQRASDPRIDQSYQLLSTEAPGRVASSVPHYVISTPHYHEHAVNPTLEHGLTCTPMQQAHFTRRTTAPTAACQCQAVGLGAGRSFDCATDPSRPWEEQLLLSPATTNFAAPAAPGPRRVDFDQQARQPCC
jgi:hypothetical protein